MWLVRFGSYSTRSTTPEMPSLSRLKSMRRYFCREPPPMWRVVMRPKWLRAPVLLCAAVNGRGGPPLWRCGRWTFTEWESGGEGERGDRTWPLPVCGFRLAPRAPHPPGDAVFGAFEGDGGVFLPRPPADVARGDAAEVVARAGLALRGGQWQVRPALVQVRAIDLHHRTRAGRSGLVLDEGHMRVLSGLGAGFVVDRLKIGRAHV